jgi:hypothetical protein
MRGETMMTPRFLPGIVESQPKTLKQKLPPAARVKLVLSLVNLLGKLRQKLMPAPLAVLELVGTYTIISNAIMVAARLGIADLLKDSPKSYEELAQAVEAQPQPLYRMLRALTNAGVFAQDNDGRFMLTPISMCLQTDTPGSMRSLLVMCSEEWHYDSWAHFLTSVKTGKTPFEVQHGMSLFQYFEQNPAAGEIFNSAMAGGSARSTAAVAASYDFSRVTTLVDIGGGVGTLVATLLKQNPQMRGVLFDRPHVLAGARRFLETAGVAERCDLVGGSFFEGVPSGGDAYVMQNVIHAWDDERATAILKSCRRSMMAYGTLLVSEMVIPPDNEPYFGTVFDLEMQVVTGSGRERTASEFKALFEAAGFKLTRIIPTPSYSYVLEGTPA